MRNIRRFFAYYKPHKGLFILDLMCAMAVAASRTVSARTAVMHFLMFRGCSPGCWLAWKCEVDQSNGSLTPPPGTVVTPPEAGAEGMPPPDEAAP